jgi:AcrR family transcriptional regulator
VPSCAPLSERFDTTKTQSDPRSRRIINAKTVEPSVAELLALVILTRNIIDVSVSNMKRVKRTYDMTARAAKAEATKARISASAVELFCTRPVEEFTLDEVAKGASTTVQTVLRIFGSKDELVYSVLEDMAAGGTFLRPTEPRDIKAAVAAFFDIYETMGDLVIERLSEERRRPGLKRGLDQGRENHRDGVKTIFAPQLERLQGAARTQLLTILIVMTDVYVWKLLRRDMAMSRPAAEAIVCTMIRGVIQHGGSNGKDSVAELVRRRQPAA